MSSGQPSERKKRLDAATEALTALVAQYPASARLPTERELGERLGVGRSTLREAISRLVALGLVRVVHGRGMYARDRAAATTSDVSVPEHSGVQTLLDRAAVGAHHAGMSESDFLATAGAAYQASAGTGSINILAPLPSTMRSEIVRLLDESGADHVDCELRQLKSATAGPVIALHWVTTRLLDAGIDIIPVGAGLWVDLTVACSGLDQAEQVIAYGADEATLAAVKDTAKSLRPDLQLTGRIGLPSPGEVDEGTILLPLEAGVSVGLRRAFCYRTGLIATERRALIRKLHQPAAEPAATVSRPSARSRIGTAASHTLD
jgi:DNA-binding transcriptional regulator YhcF (GntR family)